MKIFLIIVFVFISYTEGLWVNRTDQGDTFTGKLCGNTEPCECGIFQETFYVRKDEQKMHCYDNWSAEREESSLGGKSNVETIESNEVKVGCNMTLFHNLSIWNYFENENNSIWQNYELSTKQKADLFIMNNDAMLLKRRQRWNGLLVRFDFKCVSDVMYRSIFAKFTGARKYPLSADVTSILDIKIGKKKSNSAAIIASVIVCLLLVVGVVILALLYLKRRKKSQNSKNNNIEEEVEDDKEDDKEIYEPLTKVYDDQYEDPSKLRKNEYLEPSEDDGYQALSADLVNQKAELLPKHVQSKPDSGSQQQRLDELSQPNSTKHLSSKHKWFQKLSIRKGESKYQKPTNTVYQPTTEDITIHYKTPAGVKPTSTEGNLYTNLPDHTRSNSDTKPRVPTIIKTTSAAGEFRKKKKSNTSQSSSNMDNEQDKGHYKTPISPPTSPNDSEHYQRPTNTQNSVGNTMFNKPILPTTVKERIQDLFENDKQEETTINQKPSIVKSKSDPGKKQPPKVAPKKIKKNTLTNKISEGDDIYENIAS